MLISEGFLVAVSIILDGGLGVVIQRVGEIGDTCVESGVGKSGPTYSCTVQNDGTVRGERSLDNGDVFPFRGLGD